MKRLFYIFIIGHFSIAQAQQEDVPKEADMKAQMSLIDGERHLILENYTKALEMFATARDINPFNAAVHFKIAQVLYQSKQYDEAQESIEEALDIDPDNKFYYVLAGDIETARSDLGAAVKHYENLVKLPDTQEYLGDLALLYQYLGKNKKALETYARVQDHFGTNEAIAFEKEKLLIKLGNDDLVLAEYERLVLENPGDNTLAFLYVSKLQEANRLDLAEQQLLAILKKEPGNARAELMMTEILKKAGRLNEAMKYVRSSVLSEDVEFNLKGGILNDLLKSSSEDSNEEFKQLVIEVAAVHADDYMAQAFTGDVLFQLGYKKESLTYYLRATRINADNFSVWQNILSMESEMSMWDSLVVHSEEAIELFPNQGALYYFGGTGNLRKQNFKRATGLLEMGKRYALNNELKSAFNGQLGDAYHGMKNYPKSDQAYEAALKDNPQNEHVLNNYSYYLSLRKEKLERALELSTRLVSLQPNVSTYQDTHGWVLFNLGKYKEARKFLEKAASGKPSAAVLEHYGDVLFKLGQKKEAIVEWEKASDMGNPSELLLKKIADKKYHE